MRLLTLLSLAAAVYAETITLGAAHFDLTGCVSPAGTYNCYQQAGSAQLGGEKACNSTSSNNGDCLIGVQAQYSIEVIGCMDQGCWNRPGVLCIPPDQTGDASSGLRLRLSDRASCLPMSTTSSWPAPFLLVQELSLSTIVITAPFLDLVVSLNPLSFDGADWKSATLSNLPSCCCSPI